MAKKKRSVRSSRSVSGHKRMLVRVPYDLADWIDDTAAELGISRDALCRQFFTGARAHFKLAKQKGTDENLLYQRMEERMIQAVEKAVDQAARDVVLASRLPLAPVGVSSKSTPSPQPARRSVE